MKKVLAIAVAAAVAAPMAVAAEVTIYGKLQAAIDYVDTDVPGAGDTSVWEVNSAERRKASRLGFKGSEDLGDGLKFIWKLETTIDLSDGAKNGGSFGGARNAYVGFAGDWGTFLYGRHDTPHKISSGKVDIFGDTSADYNQYLGFHDVRADNAIAYISPNFSGFTFAGAIVPGESTVDPAPVGTVNNGEADGLADAYSVALMYDNAGIFGSLSYESLSADFLDGAAQLGGGQPFAASVAPGDLDKWRASLGYKTKEFMVAAVYENQDANVPVGGETDIWGVYGSYTMGMTTLKAMVGQADPDGNNNDTDQWTIGVDHALSKRTSVYALYTDASMEGAGGDTDQSVFSFGTVHSF